MKVLSNQSKVNELKAFGVYEIKPQTIVENHPVYINHKSGSHLVFSDYGWQVSNYNHIPIKSHYKMFNELILRVIDS